MNPALRKSVRTYRAMLAKLPSILANPAGAVMRSPEFQDAASYLRALYREYGRENVRRALSASEAPR
jgi:hypothetical protein